VSKLCIFKSRWYNVATSIKSILFKFQMYKEYKCFSSWILSQKTNFQIIIEIWF
jgi:hypothetical protein